VVNTLILDLLDPEEEFRADAVALYESTLGATCKDITAILCRTARDHQQSLTALGLT
jgi:hypothetical protein